MQKMKETAREKFDKGHDEQMTRARKIAATAWCGEKTSSTPMDADLAEEFARILVAEWDKIELALGSDNVE